MENDMPLHQLSKIDRRAALLFNRQIRLLKHRGKLDFNYNFGESPTPDISDLLDSFNWIKTPQGVDFWDKVWLNVERVVI